MGYSLDEIKGQHHQHVRRTGHARQPRLSRVLGQALNRGEFQAGQYKRIAKGGREIWIQASYNPILDKSGKPSNVIKFATDITAQKIRSMEDSGKIAAIGKAQAVIEFNMDGTIVNANENFLAAMGYSLDEIQGKHHGMFVTPAYRASPDYRAFWEKLNRGELEVRRVQAPRQGRGKGDLDPGLLQPDPRRSTASRSRWSSSRPTSPSRS